MLSPISFGSAKVYSAEEFQQLVAKPQLYSVQNTTVASTPVEEQSKPKKSGTWKKVAIGVAAAIAAAILLAEGAKRGKLTPKADAGNVTKAVLGGLNSAGNTINKFFGKFGAKAAEVVQEVGNKASEVAQNVGEKATQVAEQVSEATPELKNQVSKKLKSLPNLKKLVISGKAKIVKGAQKASEVIQETAKNAAETVSK